MRFQGLMVAGMKTVVWDIEPCSLMALDMYTVEENSVIEIN
jgi:hypothetical protein